MKKEYDIVKVRATFNKLTPIWDEDTQRGVDRLTRAVIQDITEAEAASKYNDEGVRTPKKLTLLTAKLTSSTGPCGSFSATASRSRVFPLVSL